jgi:hypothetical protein
MPEGWSCEHCGEFHLDVHAVTKITVAIEPRQYAAPATFCSFACLDAYRPHFDQDEAYASEHGSRGRIVWRVIEEERL